MNQIRHRIHSMLLPCCMILTLATISFALPAAAAPIPVKAVEKTPDGVTLTMSPGLLKIQICDDRTFHITYSPTSAIPTRTEFVVINKWTPVPFDLKQNANDVTISTNTLTLRISRATGALTFSDSSGQAILQEPTGGGKTMTAATVNGEKTFHAQQTFVSPPDEFLYGMAEAQDGIWNWRGMPIELRQLNTQAALPMLISSKGFGLLWDNASLTDFNPVDDEIPLNPSIDASKPPSPDAARTFTSGPAGDYVFFAKDGDRKDEIAIEVDGKRIAGIKNLWVPYTTAGKITLAANQKCTVKLVGGGKDVKVFARPIGDTTTFRSQVGDAIDYYVFYGPKLDDVIAAYRTATGAAPMWPKWAYGFWQCRERYSSQGEILAAAAEFRKRQIPLDLIVQDWQYWGPYGWGAYQWDKGAYPDPAAMIQTLHNENVKYMISIWHNPAGTAGEELSKAGLLINGWIDVFDPRAREIRWKYINDAFFKIGTDAFWQDATEPGDDGNSLNNAQSKMGSGNRLRNAYPLFASQDVYDGQRATTSDKRVVTLSRSSYPGAQRYAAAFWSGDVGSNWETFARQIPAGLNTCLTGLPYWTTDCAGFFRPGDQYNSDDFNELLVRWFQFSTFCPILRVHGWETETEMWRYHKAYDTLLKYDRLRYRLLPYNYSVAWQVTHEGYTIMRALPMDFSGDAKVNSISDEYMFGPAFLVSPVTTAKAKTRQVYLPGENPWINFWTGRAEPVGRTIAADAPLDQIPLFVRAGSILPLGPNLQYATQSPSDPIELRIYRGADGAFTLYDDEGDNYNYEHGSYATIPIQWNEKTDTLTLGARQGSYPGMPATRAFNIIWVSDGHGIGVAITDQVDKKVDYTGSAISVVAEN